MKRTDRELSERAAACTCLHVHVLPALHGLRRPRPELLLGPFSGSAPLLSQLLPLHPLVAGLPVLRGAGKAPKA